MLLRAQTSKRKVLPETDLIGPVKNLGVHQKFKFPSDIDILFYSKPLKFKV
jgi:hypothetical protein